MVRLLKTICVCGFCGVLAFAFSVPAFGQLTSTPQTVTLSALRAESLSVTITTPGPVNFTLTGGTADAGSVTPAWTTNWTLKASRTSVAVCVYLSGALTGTGGNTNTVPMANILGQPGGAGPFTAITGSACGQVGNALAISTTAINNGNRANGSKTDSVALEINDSALTLQADTYSGTLNIVAQATP